MKRRAEGTVGIFTTDPHLTVQSWDAWMAAATGIPESAAQGQALGSLYPDLVERGLLSRVRRVAEGAGVEVLAPALHKYFLPCPPRDHSSKIALMRQVVTIAPLVSDDVIAGVVVTIEDVTERFERDRRHADISALSDTSWRVRRAAVDAIAESDGADVGDALVEALRVYHRDPALLNAALSALGRSKQHLAASVAALLASDEAEVRTYAALALGLMGATSAVDALIARLADDDTNVRFHAIEALGRLGARRAADALATVATSGDFFLAFAALDALGLIGDGRISSRIVPLLADPALFPAAVSCLGAVGTEDVVLPLAKCLAAATAGVTSSASALNAVHDRLEAQRTGAGAFVREVVGEVAGEAGAAQLLTALSSASDEDLRGLVIVLSWLPSDRVDAALAGLLGHASVGPLVAECLGDRGVRAVPFVEQAARGTDPDTRKIAARILGRLGSPASVPALIALLTEDNASDVVMAIAGALSSIGDDRAFEPMLALTSHPDSTVRQAAVAALDSIAHPDTQSAVLERMRDSSPLVRESAVRVAGYFGYPDCLPDVLALTQDADPVVRRAAVESLAGFDESQTIGVIRDMLARDADPNVRAAAARAFSKSASSDAHSALVAATRDRGLWVRYYAVRSLTRSALHDADAYAAFVERATTDPVPPVRIAAIEALGALHTPDAQRTIVALSMERESDVSCAAVAELGRGDADVTLQALQAALEHRDERMCAAAIVSAGQLRSERTIPQLLAIAHEPARDGLRRRAAEQLGRIGGRAGHDALLGLATSGYFRESVMSALSALQPEDLPDLIAATRTASDDARECVAEALGSMPDLAARDALALLLEDPSVHVRAAAAASLGRHDLRAVRAAREVTVR